MNLGTPDSTAVADVRRYLRQFLMDANVIDVPYPIRFAIVHFAILPFRPHRSAEAYRKIWTPEGSPLLVISKQLLNSVRSRCSISVELAMRYGNPSVRTALQNLISANVEEIFLIPLFPQYAMSTYASAVEQVRKVARSIGFKGKIVVNPPFYSQKEYIEALEVLIKEHLEPQFDHIIFSYHGVPVRQIIKTDITKSHCFKRNDCCQTASPAHAYCYRYQCIQTTQLLAKRLNLEENKYTIAFQSRLGSDRWLEPATADVIVQLAKKGVKKVLALCPSFTTDCLETLEEIAMRGKETFIEHGGEELKLIPCLNNAPVWAETVSKWIQHFSETGRPLIGEDFKLHTDV